MVFKHLHHLVIRVDNGWDVVIKHGQTAAVRLGRIAPSRRILCFISANSFTNLGELCAIRAEAHLLGEFLVRGAIRAPLSLREGVRSFRQAEDVMEEGTEVAAAEAVVEVGLCHVDGVSAVPRGRGERGATWTG